MVCMCFVGEGPQLMLEKTCDPNPFLMLAIYTFKLIGHEFSGNFLPTAPAYPMSYKLRVST